jgi:hypothetical protein
VAHWEFRSGWGQTKESNVGFFCEVTTTM